MKTKTERFTVFPFHGIDLYDPLLTKLVHIYAIYQFSIGDPLFAKIQLIVPDNAISAHIRTDRIKLFWMIS